MLNNPLLLTLIIFSYALTIKKKQESDAAPSCLLMFHKFIKNCKTLKHLQNYEKKLSTC